jgi:hypothetical protein
MYPHQGTDKDGSGSIPPVGNYLNSTEDRAYPGFSTPALVEGLGIVQIVEVALFRGALFFVSFFSFLCPLSCLGFDDALLNPSSGSMSHSL